LDDFFMVESPIPAQGDFFKELPKVELHRHLEGSLRVPTMMEIVRAHKLDVKNTGYLRPLVQVDHKEPYTFENFLSKFGTLRLFYKSPDIIKRLTREAVEDAALDNIRYLELRFTPVALSRAEGFPMAQVVDWVIESVKEASAQYGVFTRLISSINRHESLAQAKKVLEVSLQRRDQGIVGIDLAGNEAQYSAEPFLELFKIARERGLRITIHAGEWGGAENVRQAIVDFGAERIGHGIRVLEDPETVALARERGTIFEVCVTSNHHSGAVDRLGGHPIKKMLDAGLNVTINTDDPSISKIDLSNEYQTVVKLGISLEQLKERITAAAEAAFLPRDMRLRLVARISEELTRKSASAE
jgi:adenosine deaminase